MCADDWASFESLIIAWQPRADGVFLTDDPQKLVQQGLVAAVPFVTGGSWSLTVFFLVLLTHTTGDCDDEGTVFSFSTLNVT
jgi:acetylcholinesterase